MIIFCFVAVSGLIEVSGSIVVSGVLSISVLMAVTPSGIEAEPILFGKAETGCNTAAGNSARKTTTCPSPPVSSVSVSAV